MTERAEQVNQQLTGWLEYAENQYQQNFAAPVSALLGQLARNPPAKFPHELADDEVTHNPWAERSDYVGHGLYGHVFRVDIGEHAYAVKYFHQRHDIIPQVIAYDRARGLHDVAQLAGFSLRHGALVMDLMAGADIDEYADRPTGCTDAEIAGLLRTMATLAERSLYGEMHGGNVRYTLGAGFSVLDYYFDPELDRQKTLQHEIAGLSGGILMEAIFGARAYSPGEFELFTDVVDSRLARIIADFDLKFEF